MKAFARVTSLAIAIIFIAILTVTPIAFAADSDSLEFVKSVPKNGNETMPVENVGIKLYFNSDVTSSEVWLNNRESFTLKDSKGNKIPVRAYKNEKEKGYILVLAEPKPPKKNVAGTLEPKSNYTLTISKELVNTSGQTLGEDETVGFRTIDVKGNSRISTYLMIGMFVIIIVIMFITARKRAKADFEAKVLEMANPYKVAKERNISVDEAKELIEAAKERTAKKLEEAGGALPVKKQKKPKQLGTTVKKRGNVHKVKGPRPISAGGSFYKTGRSAAAKKKAKVEAAKKAGSGNSRKGKPTKKK